MLLVAEDWDRRTLAWEARLGLEYCRAERRADWVSLVRGIIVVVVLSCEWARGKRERLAR